MSGFDWAQQWRLTRSSSKAEAIVTRTEPDNHCIAHYEFEVNGKQYQGLGSNCSIGVGGKLLVYYLPGDPTFSTAKTPGSDLEFMIFAPLVLAVGAGFIVMLQLGRRGTSDKQPG